ncbi:MAG TPA: hypothetical protein DCS30_14015 [Rhizobiales bacterium]|nr:hypothetical protein [Hyphomicrobiales bacterium]
MRYVTFFVLLIFSLSLLPTPTYAEDFKVVKTEKAAVQKLSNGQIAALVAVAVVAVTVTVATRGLATPVVIRAVTKSAKFIRRTKGNTKIYRKNGGYQKAKADFKSAKPTNVKPIKNGLTGKLKDGNITVRSSSKGKGNVKGAPTLEVQPKSGSKVKVRYE